VVVAGSNQGLPSLAGSGGHVVVRGWPRQQQLLGKLSREHLLVRGLHRVLKHGQDLLAVLLRRHGALPRHHAVSLPAQVRGGAALRVHDRDRLADGAPRRRRRAQRVLESAFRRLVVVHVRLHHLGRARDLHVRPRVHQRLHVLLQAVARRAHERRPAVLVLAVDPAAVVRDRQGAEVLDEAVRVAHVRQPHQLVDPDHGVLDIGRERSGRDGRDRRHRPVELLLVELRRGSALLPLLALLPLALFWHRVLSGTTRTASYQRSAQLLSAARGPCGCGPAALRFNTGKWHRVRADCPCCCL
jgi:hypothetical protein